MIQILHIYLATHLCEPGTTKMNTVYCNIQREIGYYWLAKLSVTYIIVFVFFFISFSHDLSCIIEPIKEGPARLKKKSARYKFFLSLNFLCPLRKGHIILQV